MSKRNFDKLAIAAEQNIKERDYWLEKLSGSLVKSSFPYDHPSRQKDGDEPRLGAVGFNLDGELSAQLLQLSKGSDVKLHMILLAALLVLLEKYTGNQDIIIGTPIYRQDVDIEFINTVLVIRSWTHETTTFKELLLQVWQTIVEAEENQNYPLEILLEQLGMPYARGKDFPLFDVVLLHEHIHDRKYSQCDYIDYHILFSFTRTDTHIKGTVEYRRGFYDRSSIERITLHFNRLLQVVLADVDSPICNISILSEEEKQQILYDFSGTRSGYAWENTIHELFEEQVERTPHHIALSSLELFQDMQLTYQELNQKANQLARFLKNRGIKPGSITSLMLERSLEMMVGILGILKAGGAYLPIDLTYPQERIKYMLKESGTKILLTYAGNTPQAETLVQDGEVDLEMIDIFSHKVYQGDPTSVKNENRAADPAYIIYTSGSSGRPKGVVVEHGSVVAYLDAFYQEFDITARDTALQQASCTFDAFVEEVYPALFKGGKIAICPKYVLMDSDALLGFILRHDITFISVSPLLLNEINKMPHVSGIRIFISGGDVLKREYITSLLRIKNGKVYNTYGPTETTVCATYYRCSDGSMDDPAIGRPIANYQVYILDRNLHLVPIGVPGELCIAGPGVSRGYLNNSELSSEKFITNHLPPPPPCQHAIIPGKGVGDGRAAPRSGARLYRTGDLGRWLTDGTIEFLGRIDHQVKVRGFRIELGEIEGHLLTYDAVDAALVLAKEMNEEDRYLCAYIASDRELSIPELKEYLSKILPDYMIPSHYVLLNRLPLTPNGKPDTRALEAYKPISGMGLEFTPPGSDNEMVIADIWKDLLCLDKVSIHDNFFDLGGNSMLLLKATNKIREAFKMDISYMAMFQYTTIRSLSEYLNHLTGKEMESIDADKNIDQAETLERGKSKMKKLIKRTRTKEALDG